MDCVSSAKMQVLWNGEPSSIFRMCGGFAKGVRFLHICLSFV